jgi:3-isopropylmalate/(R)-2-methylmalate dehydratase small subunit
MTARNPIRGTAVLLANANIDTDQIMPKQFCLRMDRSGYQDAAFFEWRKLPESVLNQTRARTAPLLVAGPNFGCGSSREHAVWGLLDFGFQAVVAPSYGDTFRANSGAAGLITACIGLTPYRRLLDVLHADIDTLLELDIAKQTLSVGTRPEMTILAVEIPAFHRYLYMGCHTELGLAAFHEERIRDYEVQRPAWMPRIEVA